MMINNLYAVLNLYRRVTISERRILQWESRLLPPFYALHQMSLPLDPVKEFARAL